MSPLLFPLTHLVSAQFSIVPRDLVVVENSSISIECEYPGVDHIVWKRGDTILSNSDPNFNITNRMNMSTLSANSADPSLHDGDYQCIAVLSDNTNVSTNFSITVKCKSIGS